MHRLRRLIVTALRSSQGGTPALQTTMLALSPTLFYPLTETTGTTITDLSGNGFNGVASGITLANVTGPDGVNKCPLWANTGAGHIDFYNAGLDAALNEQKFSVVAWIKSTNWGDTTIRYVWRFGADANNQVYLRKINVADYGRPEYIGGSTSDKVDWSDAKTSGKWYMTTLTVDKAAEEFKFYVDNAQFSTTQGTLGTYTGSLLNSICVLGNLINSGGTNPWGGWLAYFAIYSDTILTLENVQSIYASAAPPNP